MGQTLLAATLVVGPGVCAAQGEAPARPPTAHGAILHVTEENDAPLLTDRHYMQGFRLAYLGADDRLPDWLLNLSTDVPAPGFEVHARRLGFELGQDLYTPENLAAAELLAHDRPYAGWLYTGMVLQRRGATRQRDIPVLESLRLNLGIIGPESLAQDLQERFHRLIGEHWPQGWRHQLQTEPGFALRYQRAWQFA